MHEGVVDFFRDDGARAGRALLPLIAKRRLPGTLHGCVDVGFVVHHDGVLAAHFQNGTLDPDLTGRRLGGQLADAQADFLRSGEADVAGLRVLHHHVANDAARTSDEVDGFLGDTGFKKNIDKFCGDGWGIGGRLHDNGVAGYKRRRDDAGHDGAGEIPRRNDHADAERNISEVVTLAAHGREFLRLGEAQHFAAIEFEEVDRFGDVRVGFDPGFSDFVADEGVQLILAFANDLRGTEDAPGALGGRDFLPGVEVFVRGLDGVPGHFGGGVLKHADHFRGARGIRGVALLLGDDLLPAKPHGIFAAEFRFHRLQRVFHALAIFRLGKVDERLVGELGNVNFLFGGGHDSSLLNVQTTNCTAS